MQSKNSNNIRENNAMDKGSYKLINLFQQGQFPLPLNRKAFGIVKIGTNLFPYPLN